MSGYEVPDTEYRLQFTDKAHAGIVVRVGAMSLGEGIHAAFELGWSADDDMDTRKAKQQQLHEMFVAHLVEWNLTKKGKPVPPTYDGLLSLEPKFVGLLIGTWQVGRTAVPDPLDSDSSSGGLSPVESTLAEIPSESLAS